MASRYWIGNSGNWTDTAHWSTSSGGSGGAAAPTSSDDVFIDANSFSTTGTITLNSGTPTCKNLDTTGLAELVSVAGSLGLEAKGDTITLTDNIQFTFSGDFNIKPVTVTTINIAFGSSTFSTYAGIIFIGTASNTYTGGSTITFEILSSIIAQLATLTFKTGVASTAASTSTGEFNTNNNFISVKTFNIDSSLDLTGASGGTNANLGTSTIAASNFSWAQGVGGTIEIDGAGSSILFTPDSTSSSFNVEGSTATLGNITVSAGGTGTEVANFVGVSVFDFASYFSMEVESIMRLRNTVILNISGDFTVAGDESGITIYGRGTGESTGQGTINVTGEVEIDFLRVENCLALGNIPFVVNDGVDGGNNTNWTFVYSSLATEMYNAGTDGRLTIAPNRGAVESDDGTFPNAVIDAQAISAKREYALLDRSGTVALIESMVCNNNELIINNDEIVYN